MKRHFLTVCLLMASMASMADNHFTMGVNDTVWIRPNTLNTAQSVSVKAHFEARLDCWHLNLYWPSQMKVLDISEGPDMTLWYHNQISPDSADVCYNAPLARGVNDTTEVSSFIPVIGYWDYNHDNVCEPYGTVKWEAGDYGCMFVIDFKPYIGFTGGTFTITGSLTSGYDARGGTISGVVTFTRNIIFIVAYMRGDVNGDGYININDVTALVNYLLTDEGLDQYQLEAADFNQDGFVNIYDVTALQAYLANSPQGMESDGTSSE
ncbi:MAG: dockerin type I repeat-containing protein [Muribaculaceae bacterium]|nr:dockerin type I repeat-containing protein [Muribaculaceae bacterium]